jgi:F420-0:gamma-glutamyl ligase-like protein
MGENKVMSILSSIASLGIKNIADGIGTLATKLRSAFTGDLSPEKKAEVEEILLQMQRYQMQLESKDKELQSNVIIAEAKGKSWLQRNWRPGLMAIFGLIIFNNYIVAPYIGLLAGAKYQVMLQIPADMWGLLKLGVSGYIVGRSAEKIADGDGIKGALQKILKGMGK